jgi:hypothetical protein
VKLKSTRGHYLSNTSPNLDLNFRTTSAESSIKGATSLSTFEPCHTNDEQLMIPSSGSTP